MKKEKDKIKGGKASSKETEPEGKETNTGGVFLSGLEIHQRLDTHKLFCRCTAPDSIQKRTPSKKIKRRLHFVRSEVGEVDKTAVFEITKDIATTYEYYRESCCEVELDESPPLELNMEALEIALQIVLMLNAKPVDELHVMRKQVVDGSNTSGFQRTAVIGLDGYIETSKGKVRIDTVCLEEESAGIINKDRKVFALDRLGIPLVEIATGPDIKDPMHAKEVAEKIGMILRLAKVKRGIGTIRQDINVSVPNGARVEIKGVQELKDIPTILNNEIKRQNNLILLYKKIKPLFEHNKEFKIVDLTELLESTECNIIKKEIKKGGIVLGLKLSGFKNILGTELIPGSTPAIRYGTELAYYARAAGVQGIIHSDEALDRYGFSIEDISSIKLALNIRDKDAFVLVAGRKNNAKKAMEYLINRLLDHKVPEETRMVKGTATVFMRPLPGRERMYPETDIPPIRITRVMIEKAKANRGESLEDRIKRYENLVGKEYAERLIRSEHRELFESLVGKGHDPKLVASILMEKLVALRREGFETSKITADMGKRLEKMLGLYTEGKIVKSAMDEIIKAVCKAPSADIEELIMDKGLERVTGKQLEKIVKEEGYDMKRIMSKHRLNVDPKEVIEIIKKKKN